MFLFIVAMYLLHFLQDALETGRVKVFAELPLVVLLCIFGAYGVCHCNNVFLACIYFEIFALSLLVIPYLASGRSTVAAEGALLYLIISFVASIAFFIYGLSFFFISAGDFAMGISTYHLIKVT